MGGRDLGECPSCGSALRRDRVVWQRDPLEDPRNGEVQVACGKCLAISRAFDASYRTMPVPAILVTGAAVARALEIAKRGAEEGRLLATLDALRAEPALRSPEVYAVFKPALRGRIRLARPATLRVWRHRIRRLALEAWDAPQIAEPPHGGTTYRLGSDSYSIRFFLPAGTELNITGHKLAWAILAPLRLPFTREEGKAKKSVKSLEAEAALLQPDADR